MQPPTILMSERCRERRFKTLFNNLTRAFIRSTLTPSAHPTLWSTERHLDILWPDCDDIWFMVPDGWFLTLLLLLHTPFLNHICLLWLFLGFMTFCFVVCIDILVFVLYCFFLSLLFSLSLFFLLHSSFSFVLNSDQIRFACFCLVPASSHKLPAKEAQSIITIGNWKSELLFIKWICKFMVPIGWHSTFSLLSPSTCILVPPSAQSSHLN